MDAMMKIVSLSIRLITLAAILIPMQYTLKQMKNQKGMAGLISTAGSTADTAARAGGGENAPLLPLSNTGPAAMLPQLLGVSTPPAQAEQTAPPEMPSGPAILIHCPARGSKAAQRPGMAVIQLPSDANAAVIDGRVQIFRPATKTDHGR